MTAPRRPYVYALDWLRAITILGVVAVHGVRLSLQHVDPAPEGFIQMILQFGREGFMVMTGFVLTYQYASGRANWLTFWKRRYQNVVFPYLIWVLVFLVLEVGITPTGGLLARYVPAIETGNGHLYYLLITMQMYLVTPLMILMVRRLGGYGWVVAAGAVLLEFTLWSLPAYQGPSILNALGLWTYAGFYILGAVVGYHWPAIEGWVRAHRRGFVAAWALAAIGVAPIYFAEDAAHGVVFATNVFQPLSVLYTLAAVACILALGTWYADWRGRGGRLATLVFLLSEYSFAMYLVHPMFLDGWLWLSSHWPGFSPWLNMVLVVLVGWSASLGASLLLRQLPGSPYIIGMSRAAHALRRPVARETVALRSTS